MSGLRDRVARWPMWAVLLGGYAVSRVVVGLIVQLCAMWAQPPAGVGSAAPGYWDLAVIWDGQWYQWIARWGYPLPLPTDPITGRPSQSPWAFYPAFPLAVRQVMGWGVPFATAAVLLNVAAGAVAVLLLGRLMGATAAGRRLPERMAVLAALLWLFYPSTAVLQIAYSEALGMAVLCAALLLLVRRRYLLCSLAVLTLGFTRGIAPPLGVVVLTHLILRWRQSRADPASRLAGQRLSALALVIATAAAAVAWPAYVGWRTGRWDAFFAVQATWGQRPDKGPFVAWLEWAWRSQGLVGVMLLIGGLTLGCVLVLGPHGSWLAPELRAWAVAYPLFLFGLSGPSTSMWRFLLLDFPLFAVLVSVVVRGAGVGHVRSSWPLRLSGAVAVLLAGVVWWTSNLLVYTPTWDWPP